MAEDYNDGKGDRSTNAARIIRERLLQKGYFYHLCSDWSHIGFGRYLEGSAILSRKQFIRHEAVYVSALTDIDNIHSRKVVMAQIHFPQFGRVNVFSVHLSWWDSGFSRQFERLQQWADAAASGDATVTLLCGDFNNKAGSPGYMQIVEGGKYEDQFLRAASPEVFSRVFRECSPERQKLLEDDSRIDFIFANKNAGLKASSAMIMFSGKNYRRVSDHPGYLTEFEPTQA